jgi:VanZ family protein
MQDGSAEPNVEDGQESHGSPAAVGALFSWLPPLAWMLLIFLLSSQSHLPRPAHRVLDQLAQASAHMLLYGVLLVLVWRAMRETWPERRVIPWALLVTLAYAVTDEYHQTFVMQRHGTPVDVALDVAGMLLALGAMRAREAKVRGSDRLP